MMVIFLHTAVSLDWFLHSQIVRTRSRHTECYLFQQVAILSESRTTLNWYRWALFMLGPEGWMLYAAEGLPHTEMDLNRIKQKPACYVCLFVCF